MVLLAAVHGGLACWIQDANYLVAAVPLALGAAGIIHFRTSRHPSARLRGAVYLAASWGFLYYAFIRVESHRDLLASRETELQPLIDALAAEQQRSDTFPADRSTTGLFSSVPPDVDYRRSGDTYQLWFRHNIIRRHVFDASTNQWSDDWQATPTH